MKSIAVIIGIWTLLAYLCGLPSLDEAKRNLQGEVDNIRGRMLDIQRRISPTPAQQGNKRKRDDDLNSWMVEGWKLVKEAQRLISQIGSWRCNLLSAKVRWEVCKLLKCLKAHDTKGDQLLAKALSAPRDPCYGYYIPVKQIIGQVASKALVQLKRLLEADKIGRIAIHGEGGTGKTFIMKHLHNWARNKFDYVFWISSPVEFTAESVQDAVAEAVHCNFASDDAFSVRVKKLSCAISKLGSVVIFLDGAPEVDLFLNQVGIPTPDDGIRCKLVLSTCSTLESTMSHSFEKVKITHLTEKDAYKMFLHKANIGEGSVTSLDDIPLLLANRCAGLPRLIENTATHMCGIDDVREWRNAEVELVGP